MAVWLDDVLDALRLESIHLIGYSEGGWIAAVHAAPTKHLDRLATLTLIEPGGAIERIATRTLGAWSCVRCERCEQKDKPRALRDFNRWMNGDVELTGDEQRSEDVGASGKCRRVSPHPGSLAQHAHPIPRDMIGMMSERKPRDGYHAVTPRIVIDDVEAQVEFLREVSRASGYVESGRPAEVRIGDSLIMISSGSDRELFPGFLYVYVDDADQTQSGPCAPGRPIEHLPHRRERVLFRTR